MPRTSIATDNFNRAGPALGSDWASLNDNWGSPQITASTLVYGGVSQTDNNRQVARWVGAGTFTNDQYSSLVISSLAFNTGSFAHGVVVRASADVNANRDFYQACVEEDSSGPNYTTRLAKFVNGTYTLLHSASVAWTVGDRIELEVEGTTLRVCKNGTPLGGSFTQTDSDLSTGNPGIAVSGDATVTSDDWEGGNITAAVVPTGRGLLLGVG